VIVIDGKGGSSNSHFSSSTGAGGDDETIADVLGPSALLYVNFNAVNSNAGSTAGEQVTSLGHPGHSQNDLRCCEDNLSNDGTPNLYISACTLPGGSSGGPWAVDGGVDVFSVNSHTDVLDGMAWDPRIARAVVLPVSAFGIRQRRQPLIHRQTVAAAVAADAVALSPLLKGAVIKTMTVNLAIAAKASQAPDESASKPSRTELDLQDNYSFTLHYILRSVCALFLVSKKAFIYNMHLHNFLPAQTPWESRPTPVALPANRDNAGARSQKT
jgi:hypothetical protein